MEQPILFPGCSPPNVNSYASLKIFVNILFQANSYSLHPIKLKLDL